MNRPDPRCEWMSLEDVEEMLPDKPDDETWELIGGRVIRTMAGARWEHHHVVGNIAFALQSHLRRKALPCLTFRETFWLKDKTQDLAVFPDVIVRPGAMTPGQTSVDDPVILVEVLSRGTATRDLLEKRPSYRQIPSVAHIVFVTLDDATVDVTSRRDGEWSSTIASRPEDVVVLDAIDFSMPVAAVFEGLDGFTASGLRPVPPA